HPPRGRPLRRLRASDVTSAPVPAVADRPVWLGLPVVLCAGVVAGIVLRVVVYRSSLGVLDGDEAVWGLMARHLLDGEFSAFFWGQGYGGRQEEIPPWPSLALFGTTMVPLP